ncbi:MAG: hypothetical protein LKJ88_01815 [Bacilli bacterium]|jgi:hypothetical protein|nr:hypothetical protein [Bacilli bacterium]
MKAIRNFQPFILCLVGLLLGGCSSSQASIDAKNEETKTYTYHRIADPTSSQLDTISSYDSLIATKNYIDSQALFLEDKHSVEEVCRLFDDALFSDSAENPDVSSQHCLNMTVYFNGGGRKMRFDILPDGNLYFETSIDLRYKAVSSTSGLYETVYSKLWGK